MSYLNFNKAELVNLEYSLKRELLATNRLGGYCNTTLVGCNTRKYHGLFVIPIEKFEGKRHLLLSALDETLTQHNHSFNLGIRDYGTLYEPRGHKYIVDFELNNSATLTYKVGGMLFQKSLLFVRNQEQLLIKYTLLDAASSTKLTIKPFLAFREIHSLTKANSEAETSYTSVENGAAYKMYEGFPKLYIQFNKKGEYISQPDWYRNVEYMEEKRRGYDYREDLFVPGLFEFSITKGESVIISISTKEIKARGLKSAFEKEFKLHSQRDSFDACLKSAAKQFLIKTKNKSEIVAGYTWLGKGLRETLLSLPGLTIFNDGDTDAFNDILDNTIKSYSTQLLKGSRQAEGALWFFWLAQQYSEYVKDDSIFWNKYGTFLKKIVMSYINGERMGVQLMNNGLLWTKMNGVALSWMNAYLPDGTPITERAGYQVETNALWYNAVSYLIDHSKSNLKVLKEIQKKIEENFYNIFWVEERNHLADYVDDRGQNKFTRPNQLIACVLQYSPIGEDVKGKIFNAVKKELLTFRGIRTLSPKNPLYKGLYEGDHQSRDLAYHQGSTRTWLLGFYIEAGVMLYGKVFVQKAIELVDAYEEDMTIHGIGCISEVYDGNPPHNPHGAISHSVATASLIRAKYLISQFNKKEKK